MANRGEVTIQRDGKQSGATFTVDNQMLKLKTHTETRSVELLSEDPDVSASGADGDS